MTKLRKSTPVWKLISSVSVCLFLGAGAASATGFYGDNQFLDQGGKSIDATPEFYWELEVKRLASGFKPPEKWQKPKETPRSDESTGEENPLLIAARASTEDADLADFAAALKQGAITPGDPDQASKQHEAARSHIAVSQVGGQEKPPEEFPSEFSDYHRGALAYRQGKWEEAKTAWLTLLQRPDKERHYRTVWAAFMLGKAALKMSDPKAVDWFQKTRNFAATGFADSLAMAADSYGWEGRSQWKQGSPEKAAPLFLTQMALGDRSAIISLKALIPDRLPIYGMLNYGPEEEERSTWTAEKIKEEDRKAQAALDRAARDPLLRRLVTAHILASESGPDYYGEQSEATAVNRCERWLAILKKAKVEVVEDSEYLGWVAYTNGNYRDAEAWLKLVKSPTPASSWLKAKLLRRAGKLEEATACMRSAFESVESLGNSGLASDPPEDWYSMETGSPHWSVPQSAGGDLAALYLLQSKFVPALEALKQGGLWEDAAYVAERILTADELKTYVDALPPAPAPAEEGATEIQDRNTELRYLLGRRLVREDRYEEAAAYLPEPYKQILALYSGALSEAADEKLPKLQRARAWFKASWIARFDGMELMGTEGTPDGFLSGGSFEATAIVSQRMKGTYPVTHYGEGDSKVTNEPLVLKPTKLELERLAKNQINPEIRFHYRVIAAALAMRAAALLPDNSEELADVVNTAGNWVKDRDEKTANRYFLVLKKRCPETTIGRAALAKHWFVDESGPWNVRENETREALMKKLLPEQQSEN